MTIVKIHIGSGEPSGVRAAHRSLFAAYRAFSDFIGDFTKVIAICHEGHGLCERLTMAYSRFK